IELYVKYSGSVATDARIDHLQIKVYYTEPATDAEDWLNTNSATTQDDVDAYVSFTPSTDDTSDWLQLTNFGFSIPAGATIEGIEIQIDKHATQSTSIKDGALYLRKTGGQVGDDKADTINYWDIVIDSNYDSYGGSTDLWGTNWTVSDINSANFGIDLYTAYFGSIATDSRIDHAQIVVYYTTVGGGGSYDSTGSPTTHNGDIAWLKFDEGVGNNAIDSVGKNQNGTIYGALWTSDSKLGDNALQFDGVDDYIDVDYNLPNTGYTMSAWYKTIDNQLTVIIGEGGIGESVGTNVQEFKIWGGGTQIGFRTETGSGGNHDYYFTPTGNIIDGQWHFMAAVITPGSLVIYWDDQKFTSSFINSDTTAGNCWISSYAGPGSGSFFNGSI
ncbi:hypothetical protein LCGC14_2897860, partial [marine sediment metagenome]